MGLFKRNPFGHILFLKTWLIRIAGIITHRRYRSFNELHIEGSEIIRSLPDTNVLFISNHQTYFADVVAMFHVFNASLKGRENNIKNVLYLWNPKLNLYYVAAKDTENIKIALEDGWVITFPQGTTRSFKPVRKGTAHIILQHKPIVVPIVIDGFRRSFDRKGLRIKKKGILQSFVIKEPLKIDYENATVDEVVEMIEFAIEQHPSLLKVIPAEELDEKAKLDRERMWKY